MEDYIWFWHDTYWRNAIYSLCWCCISGKHRPREEQNCFSDSYFRGRKHQKTHTAPAAASASIQGERSLWQQSLKKTDVNLQISWHTFKSDLWDVLRFVVGAQQHFLLDFAKVEILDLHVAALGTNCMASESHDTTVYLFSSPWYTANQSEGLQRH